MAINNAESKFDWNDKTITYGHGDGWGYEVSIDDDDYLVIKYFEQRDEGKKYIGEPSKISTFVARDLFKCILRDFFDEPYNDKGGK
jgi:hypothetical protein